MTTPEISAAVLAGGHSRRLGTDKAFLRLQPDSPPLLATIVARLHQVADDVFIVGPYGRGYEVFGVPVVPEEPPDRGPLAGIEAALETARHDRCLIVSCDLPFLNPVLLAWMAALPFDADALVPVLRDTQDRSDRPQSLHAIYRRASLPAVRDLLAHDRRRVAALLSAITVHWLAEVDLRRSDPDLVSFLNLNTPTDLATAITLSGQSLAP